MACGEKERVAELAEKLLLVGIYFMGNRRKPLICCLITAGKRKRENFHFYLSCESVCFLPCTDMLLRMINKQRWKVEISRMEIG